MACNIPRVLSVVEWAERRGCIAVPVWQEAVLYPRRVSFRIPVNPTVSRRVLLHIRRRRRRRPGVATTGAVLGVSWRPSGNDDVFFPVRRRRCGLQTRKLQFVMMRQRHGFPAVGVSNGIRRQYWVLRGFPQQSPAGWISVLVEITVPGGVVFPFVVEFVRATVNPLPGRGSRFFHLYGLVPGRVIAFLTAAWKSGLEIIETSSDDNSCWNCSSTSHSIALNCYYR